MGNTSLNTKIQGLVMKTKTASSPIGETSICPNCEAQFPPTTTYETFDSHVTMCLQSFHPSDMQRKRRKKSTNSEGYGSEQGCEDQDMISIEMYTKKKNDGIKNPEHITIDQKIKHSLILMEKSEARLRMGEIIKEIISNKGSKKQEEQHKWVKCVILYSYQSLQEKLYQEIIKQTTPYKILWLGLQIDSRRINWKQGSQQIVFHPNHIVRDSYQILEANLYKQLKLNVINDVVHDAGGLLRQWSALIFRQLTRQYCIFQVSNQDTGHYRFSNTKLSNIEQEEKDKIFLLIGRVLAKIVIQKITIPIKFDHIFLRFLLGYSQEEIQLQDMKSFDQQIYNSLKYLHQLSQQLKAIKILIKTIGKKQQNDLCQKQNFYELTKMKNAKEQQIQENLCLNFVVSASSVHQHSEQELITDGKNIFVKDQQGIDRFIGKMLGYYYGRMEKNRQINLVVKQFNKWIKNGFFKKLLNPEEFQLLINGISDQQINVKDWKQGTEYKQPYNKDHKVIKYFWGMVEKMNQKQKRALLKFVTGSECLPVFGFKNLETNRGDTSHFMIEPIKYDKKKCCFPKSHTCFNRLVLPIYPSQETLAQGLFGVINSNFQGVWGIE